jgi:hypothetical protein
MAVSMLAVFVSAAGAHTPGATLTCEDGLQVDLLYYEPAGINTVDVSIDGTAVDGSPFTFSETLHKSWSVGSPTVGHSAVVDVKAWDDPTGAEGWTKTFELKIPACQEPTPTATPVPTPTATPVPTPTATPDPTPTPTPTGTPDTEVTPTPTTRPTPTPTPSGTVVAETGTPRITPPSTDGLASDAGTSGPGNGLALVLVLLGGASIALLPVTSRRSRRR